MITGYTTSGNYPTVLPLQAAGGSHDVIVTKLSAAGSALVFSTYLGGASYDDGYAVALDAGGFVHVAGSTRSEDFPLAYPYQDSLSNPPNYDAFAVKFCGRSGFLVYSSYFGGQGDDAAYGIAVDEDNRAYLAGGTTSDDFPLEDPYQAARAGDEDAFLSVIGHTPRLPVLQGGDYNGDGTVDIAIFREAAGLWLVRGSTRAYFGTSGDIPASGDYSGDGTSEIAVFRPSRGLWVVRNLTRFYFGQTDDTAVPAGYGGGGAVPGVYRPASGLWVVRGLTRFYFGAGNDLPVPAPYGGGAARAAVYRGTSGLWIIRNQTRWYFGARTDYPVPGAYAGGGNAVPAIYRPETGLWAVKSLTRAYFGDCRFKPVPADYDGSGSDGIALFRPATGLWTVRELTRAYFGKTLDIPVAR